MTNSFVLSVCDTTGVDAPQPTSVASPLGTVQAEVQLRQLGTEPANSEAVVKSEEWPEYSAK